MNKRERLFHLLQCVLVSALVAGAVVIGLPRLHAAGSASFVDPSRNDFRLTLQTGVAVPSADQTSTTVYCTPYKGDHISLYTSAVWNDYSSAEFSVALGTLTSGLPYDFYCSDSAGAPALNLVAWANGTTRATALVQQNGVWCKTGALGNRYVGTIYTSSTTQTKDAKASRYLWNANNRVPSESFTSDATASWTHSANSLAAMNAGNAAWKRDFVIGLDEDSVELECVVCGFTKAAAANGYVGVGLDSTTALATDATSAISGSTPITLGRARYSGRPGIGYHYLQGLQGCDDTNTATYYGNAQVSGKTQSGTTLRIMR